MSDQVYVITEKGMEPIVAKGIAGIHEAIEDIWGNIVSVSDFRRSNGVYEITFNTGSDGMTLIAVPVDQIYGE